MRARPVAVLLQLVWVLPVLAEDPPAAEPREPSEILISEVRQLEDLSSPEAGKAFALLGRVTIEVPGVFRLRAQRMVVWLHPDADRQVFDLVREMQKEEHGLPLWTVRAVYAEGGRLPAVFQAAGRIFRCSSLYYDFESHRGVLVDAALRLRRDTSPDEAPDLVLRAKKLRSLGPGHWRGHQVRFFSSDYHEHEVVFDVERIELRDSAVKEALGNLTRIRRRDYRDGQGPTEEEVDAFLAELEAASADTTAKHVTLDEITTRAYGVRFFRWRRLTADGAQLMPLRLEFDVGGRGRLGPGARVGVGLDKKPVSWLIGGGYYLDRGPLFDAEFDVDAWDGRLQGRSFGVYLHDHGDDLGVTPPTRDRWWTKNQYRLKISDIWRLDAEYADLSDPAWLRTYDEAEFKEEKEQETLLYLRGRGNVGYVSLIYKWRTIPFATVLEQLPRARADLPVWTLLRLGESSNGEPITLQVAGSVEVANLRNRQGTDTVLPDFRTARVDFAPTLFVSFNVGGLRVIPFGTFRMTGYESDLAGDSVGRYAGSAGVRADIQLARWYRVYRHVINLSFEYVDMYSVTVPATELFPLDPVDRITPYEALSARWRNRVQRRTAQGLVEVFNLEFYGAWFPDGQRPLGRTGDGFLETDLRWWARRNLRIGGRALVEFETGTLETAALQADWQATPAFGVAAMIRHLEGDSDILTASFTTTVDTRWELVAFGQIDFKNTEGLDQGLLIRRYGKTAVISMRLFYDASDEDVRLSFKIDLLEGFRKKERTRDEERQHLRWQ
ncbi:MAG: LPS assembly protein LptD [Planctomycetota bacterium]|jgi:hypothetical protein